MTTEESSSITIDSLESLEISSTQTSRRNKSIVHHYYRKPSENELVRDSQNRKLYYCSLCSYNASSTTNIRYHLQSKHEIEPNRSIPRTKATAANQLRELWKQASIDNQSTEFNSLILKSVLNRDVLDQALVNLVVVRSLPFRVIEWPEFHAFCQALNPELVSYITTTHSAISKSIQQSFQVQKDIVRKKLQSALTNIHLSVDIWTSPNNRLLLAICSHFVDSQETRTKALLALRTVANHSGEEQWKVYFLFFESMVSYDGLEQLLPIIQQQTIYSVVRSLNTFFKMKISNGILSNNESAVKDIRLI